MTCGNIISVWGVKQAARDSVLPVGGAAPDKNSGTSSTSTPRAVSCGSPAGVPPFPADAWLATVMEVKENGGKENEICRRL